MTATESLRHAESTLTATAMAITTERRCPSYDPKSELHREILGRLLDILATATDEVTLAREALLAEQREGVARSEAAVSR